MRIGIVTQATAQQLWRDFAELCLAAGAETVGA